MHEVSIVMPAFKAQETIASAVLSVIQQSYKYWELIIVADDDVDYEAILGRAGLLDKRIRFLSTGGHGSGSPVPRNLGLDTARFEYSAILDADDMMHPHKLELAVEQLKCHPIISCALQLLTINHQPLRTVGEGSNGILTSRDYKFTNFSSDSMLVYDRRVSDPRFDLNLPCVTDVDFLLKLFAKCDHCFHFGETLHFYVKRSISVTNGPGASQKIALTKEVMLSRLSSGYYQLYDLDSIFCFESFFSLSLKAEKSYGADLKINPNVLFEDYIEREMLAIR
jgi:glycosyltransferase involved in cell wall biosynthesis